MEQKLFEKKNPVSITKPVCETKHAIAIRLKSPNANYDTSMHMFECFQKSSGDLPSPSPTPHPSPRYCAVLFSLSGWSAVTITK